MWNDGRGKFREKIKYLIAVLYEDIEDQVEGLGFYRLGIHKRV